MSKSISTDTVPTLATLQRLSADSDLTEVEIEKAIKISRQALETKLEEEERELQKQCVDLIDEFNIVRNTLKPLQAMIRQALRNQVAQDDNLTRLRLAANEFLGHQVDSNWELIQSDQCEESARWLTGYSFQDNNYFRAFSKAGDKTTVEVDYRMYIAIQPHHEFGKGMEDAISNEYSVEIDLPEAFKDGIKPLIEVAGQITSVRDQFSDVKRRRSELDKTMKKLEAEILLSTMASTDRGKQIVDVATAVVSQALNTPLKSLTTLES